MVFIFITFARPPAPRPTSSPGVNFINVLQAAFTSADLKSPKKADNLTVFLRFWDLQA